jgi:hypothetical protein
MTPQQFKMLMQGIFIIAWILVDGARGWKPSEMTMTTMDKWTSNCEEYYKQEGIE